MLNIPTVVKFTKVLNNANQAVLLMLIASNEGEILKIRDMANITGLSNATVQRNIKSLIDKGFIYSEGERVEGGFLVETRYYLNKNN